MQKNMKHVQTIFFDIRVLLYHCLTYRDLSVLYFILQLGKHGLIISLKCLR